MAADPYPVLGRLTQWYVLLGGPLAWAVHLLVSYGPVEIACSAAVPLFLHGVTLVTMIAALGSALLGWRAWSRARKPEPTIDEAALGRTRFIAACGMILGGFFAVVILLEGVPVLLVDPCMRVH